MVFKPKHGQHGSPTYKTWLSMRNRCNSVTHDNYARYGGRGIKIDPVWGDYSQFLADMGAKPSNTQLDRIDNNGPYTKTNCRWVSAKENCRNKSTNYLLTAFGVTACVSAWAEALEVSLSVLHLRAKAGWSHEKVVSTPIRFRGPPRPPKLKPTEVRITANNKTLTITEWAAETGILRNCIVRRLRRGWSTTEAVTLAPKRIPKQFRKD